MHQTAQDPGESSSSTPCHVNTQDLATRVSLVLDEITDERGRLRPGLTKRLIRRIAQYTGFLRHVRVPLIRPGTHNSSLDLHTFELRVTLSDDPDKDVPPDPRSFRNIIMWALAHEATPFIDDLIVHGDTSLSGQHLGTLDGILKQAHRHVVDLDHKPITDPSLAAIAATMPLSHRGDDPSMCFFVSPSVIASYFDHVADGENAMLELWQHGQSKLTYNGMPLLEIPALARCNDILLTDPKNIIVGFEDDAQVALEKNTASGAPEIVLSLRMGVKYDNEHQVVRAINVHPGWSN